jgi:putative membrane protein
MDAEFQDVTRRTHLAAERTWLAWWRTAIAAAIGALAVGGLVPELVDTPWPYIALGSAYAAASVGLFVCGALRQRAVDRALADGGFERLPESWMLAFSAVGALLAAATLVVVLAA